MQASQTAEATSVSGGTVLLVVLVLVAAVAVFTYQAGQISRLQAEMNEVQVELSLLREAAAPAKPQEKPGLAFVGYGQPVKFAPVLSNGKPTGCALVYAYSENANGEISAATVVASRCMGR